MKQGWTLVSKRTWYALGGFAEPRCVRRADKRGAWRYYFA